MAQKSKTQRAKASAKRAARREADSATVEEAVEAPVTEEKKGLKLFKRSEEAKSEKKAEPKPAPKKESKPKKPSFLKEVRSELKRVTWPTRTEVLRWSGVVVVALVFISAFVFVLDNWIVTPLLLVISSLGA